MEVFDIHCGLVIASVVEEREDKIHLYISERKHYEWFDKNSSRLLKLHTTYLPNTKLSSLPRECRIMKAIYYEYNGLQYIIGLAKNCIIRYDIKANQWANICPIANESNEKYSDVQPINMCFDSDNFYLYVLKLHSLRVHKRDVSGTKWILSRYNAAQDPFQEKETVVKTSIKANRYGGTEATAMLLLNRQIHFFSSVATSKNDGHGSHFCLDTTNSQLYEVKDNIKWLDAGKQMIYCRDQQRMYGFNSRPCPNVLRGCNITVSDEYEWFECDYQNIQRAFFGNGSKRLILAFENILFVFYGSKHVKIGCIGLFNKTFYKTERTIYHPGLLGDGFFIIKGNDNYMYFIESSDYGGSMQKISLFEIVPNKLKQDYRNHYINPLIFGYIAEMKKNKQLRISVSIDNVEIIMRYYDSLNVFDNCK
eukprot:320848_1